MAVDKLVDSSQLNSDLTSVANAIRTKGGTSASLAFPSGFVAAIGDIPTGAKKVTGAFTVGSSETTHTISFGETLSRYMFLIEMTDDSKTTLASSGNASARSYAFTGLCPSPGINNSAPANCMTPYRIKPSTGEMSYSQSTVNTAASSISIGCADLNGGAHYLYRGYSYNYYVVEVT